MDLRRPNSGSDRGEASSLRQRGLSRDTALGSTARRSHGVHACGVCGAGSWINAVSHQSYAACLLPTHTLATTTDLSLPSCRPSLPLCSGCCLSAPRPYAYFDSTTSKVYLFYEQYLLRCLEDCSRILVQTTLLVLTATATATATADTSAGTRFVPRPSRTVI